MVCTTLSVTAAAAPNIYISSTSLTVGTVEVTGITYGETVRMTTRFTNSGNAGGRVWYHYLIDAVDTGIDVNVWVDAGSYIDQVVDFESTWVPYGLTVGSHQICVEITSVTTT